MIIHVCADFIRITKLAFYCNLALLITTEKCQEAHHTLLAGGPGLIPRSLPALLTKKTTYNRMLIERRNTSLREFTI